MEPNPASEEIIAPRGSLAADILFMNNAGPASTVADLKRIQQIMQEKSGTDPLRHSMDRGERGDE